MAWSGASPAVPLRARRFRTGLELNRLEAVVLALDPGSRALLDLSLRRRIRDDDLARMLRLDPFNVAWLRARAIERVAAELGMNDAIGIGRVRAALPPLPDRVWGVPAAGGERRAPERRLRLVSPTPDAPPSLRNRGRRPAPRRLRPVARTALIAGAGAVLGLALSRRRR